jgi:hypothetical protein
MATFLTHYKTLYIYTPTDKHRWQRFLDQIETWPHLTSDEQDLLAKRLDGKGVIEAIKLCQKRKSHGMDGIPYEFYNEYWDLIGADMVPVFNDILQHKTLGGTQKQRKIILVHKTSNPYSITDFRPITLLNTDFKVLTKTLANRLKHYFTKIIHMSQKGCVPGGTILDFISTIRDVIAYKTVT